MRPDPTGPGRSESGRPQEAPAQHLSSLSHLAHLGTASRGLVEALLECPTRAVYLKHPEHGLVRCNRVMDLSAGENLENLEGLATAPKLLELEARACTRGEPCAEVLDLPIRAARQRHGVPSTAWRARVIPLFDEAGAPAGVLGVLEPPASTTAADPRVPQAPADTPPSETPDTLPDPEPEALAALFRTSVVGLAVLDPNGAILAANPALREMLGPGAGHLAGRRLQDCLSLAHEDAQQHSWQDLLAGRREALRADVSLPDRTGQAGRSAQAGQAEPRHARMTVHRMRGAEGERVLVTLEDMTDRQRVMAALRKAQAVLLRNYDQRSMELETSNTLLLREVTERRITEERLRESEERFRMISDAAKDGIVMTDHQGCIVFWNRAATGIFGYRPDEVLQRHLHDVVVPERYHTESAKGLAEFASSGKGAAVGRTVELAGMHKDGREFPLELSLSAVFFRGNWHAIGLVRDISERRMVQETMRRAMEEAEAASQMKSDFLSMVSHELRTPLTSIIGFAKMIGRKLDRAILPLVPMDHRQAMEAIWQVRENLAIIQEEGGRLTQLVNDVLDLSRLEAGKLEWRKESCRLLEVVERSLSAVQVLIDQKGLYFREEFDPTLPEVLADKDSVIQVLVNLFSNAIKFTDTGGITCRVCRSGPDMVCVSVSDTGIGIPAPKQEVIFEKFRQLGDALTDRPRGTGLGLAICKEIVERHGGSIWLESELGQGCTFLFTLPVLKAAADLDGGQCSVPGPADDAC